MPESEAPTTPADAAIRYRRFRIASLTWDVLVFFLAVALVALVPTVALALVAAACAAGNWAVSYIILREAKKHSTT